MGKKREGEKKQQLILIMGKWKVEFNLNFIFNSLENEVHG